MYCSVRRTGRDAGPLLVALDRDPFQRYTKRGCEADGAAGQVAGEAGGSRLLLGGRCPVIES
ncbi:hypothetical protein [Streptomyces fractus]|uniref:hypothetical protein n=1 Tax=Streptomyces fractus TaxID=641806 RepID=UPI003CF043DF